MPSPLQRAWSTLRRYPLLAGIPLAWELLTIGMAGVLGVIEPTPASASFSVHVSLPTVLPSGSDLLGPNPFGAGLRGSAATIMLGLITFLIGALVAAGYLHLIARALQGEPPTWDGFVEGVSRFGPRLVSWRLMVAAAFVAGMIAAGTLGRGVVWLLLPVALVALVLTYLVDFLIPVRDLEIAEALRRSPRLLSERLGDLALVAVASLAVSGLLSAALSLTRLNTLIIAAPLWCFAGTWLSAAVCAVINEHA